MSINNSYLKILLLQLPVPKALKESHQKAFKSYLSESLGFPLFQTFASKQHMVHQDTSLLLYKAKHFVTKLHDTLALEN